MIIDGRGFRYDPSVVKVFQKITGGAEAEAVAGPEKRVASSMLEADARLSRDLMGLEGALLLSKGYVLDEKLIQQIRQHEKKVGKALEIWIAGK